MEMITEVLTSELLEILKKNRANHIREYSEAYSGYLEGMREWHVDQIKALDHCPEDFDEDERPCFYRPDRSPKHLPEPKDMTADYDEAISFVELHRQNTMKLDRQTHQAWVMDRWTWTEHTKTLFSNYTDVTW